MVDPTKEKTQEDTSKIQTAVEDASADQGRDDDTADAREDSSFWQRHRITNRFYFWVQLELLLVSH
jgi:hypothetical protein